MDVETHPLTCPGGFLYARVSRGGCQSRSASDGGILRRKRPTCCNADGAGLIATPLRDKFRS